MRRVITAFAMLAVSVIGIAVITIIIDNQIEETEKNLTFLYQNLEKMSIEDVIYHVNILNNKWKKTEKILKFVSVHDIVDSISENIENLNEATNHKNKKEIRNICFQLKIQLHMFCLSEKPLVENIF